MTEIDVKNEPNHFGVLNFIQDEIEKIKRSIPKYYDDIAKFLAISRPIVEVVSMNCGDWTDQTEPRGPGKRPISHASLMLIHILAKMINVSYRDMERTLNAHPSWLKALKLEVAPSHSRLSTFRTEMGDSFFKDFFSQLTNLIAQLGVISGKAVIVDSAPITASMNFPRANATPKLNMEHVKDFFSHIDISPAIKVLRIGRKSTYPPEAIIRFFMYEKLGGFISTSQALKFVRNNEVLANCLGFVNNKVPTQPSLNYFVKTHGAIPNLLKPLVDQVTEYFDACETTSDESSIDFFFWSI
jgi:hypothetical protein